MLVALSHACCPVRTAWSLPAASHIPAFGHWLAFFMHRLSVKPNNILHCYMWTEDHGNRCLTLVELAVHAIHYAVVFTATVCTHSF